MAYVFYGDEFTFITDATAQTTNILTFVDDSYASATITLSGPAKLWSFMPHLTIIGPEANNYRKIAICYAVIGSAIGVSEVNGMGDAEVGTLEARLTVVPGPVRFIPTHEGQGLPASEIASLSIRSGQCKEFYILRTDTSKPHRF